LLKSKQEAQLSLELADRTAYIWRSASDFGHGKKTISQWLQSHTRYSDAAISKMLQSTLGYDQLIRRGQKLCILKLR